MPVFWNTVRHETKAVEVREYTEVKITCDLCQRLAHDWYGQSMWCPMDAENNVAETELVCKTGFNREFGGSIESLEADVCVECFKNKIVPALEAIGLTFTKRDINV
jgi:hypothetical protein